VHEDPEDKLILVTAEDEGHADGFWPGEKDEQSQAYARRATGDYLWQVDVDEFYKPEDVRIVLNILRDHPDITAVSFKMLTFWGGFDYTVDGWYLRQGAEIYHRLFKWGPGYTYVTHRPPTVHDAQGRDLRSQRWVNGYDMARRGPLLYHYSLLLPRQVNEKARYYAAQPWGRYSNGVVDWARDNFAGPISRPFQAHNVHTHPSWLERYSGQHPDQVQRLRQDLEMGKLDVRCRDNHDIQKLVRLPSYRLISRLLACLSPIAARSRLFAAWLFGLVSQVTYNRTGNRLSLRRGNKGMRR
jgi:hypothetical protein